MHELSPHTWTTGFAATSTSKKILMRCRFLSGALPLEAKKHRPVRDHQALLRDAHTLPKDTDTLNSHREQVSTSAAKF